LLLIKGIAKRVQKSGNLTTLDFALNDHEDLDFSELSLIPVKEKCSLLVTYITRSNYTA